MFLYFLQWLWSLFIQNRNVFRYLHSGGFIWWIPHAHFLNCLRLKFIPCVCSRLGSRLLRNWCVRDLYPTLGGWFLLDLHAFLELFMEDNFLMFDSTSFCCFAQAKCLSGLTHSSSSPDFVTAFNLWGWHLSQPDGPVNGILFSLSWHLLARLIIKAFLVGRFGCYACPDCGCPYSPWQSKVFL